MADRKTVLESIRKMLDSGIEEDVIESTLLDIGLSKTEIGELISEVKTGKTAEQPSPQKQETRVFRAAPSSGQRPLPEGKSREEVQAESQPVQPEKEKAEEIQKARGEEEDEEEESPPAEEEGKTKSRAPESAGEGGEEEEETESDELRETSDKVELAEHAEELEKMNDSLENIQRKIALLSQKQFTASEFRKSLDSLEERVEETRKDLSDLKASSSALQSLLKKLIETDRKLLVPGKK